jgi:hypothetical protein
MILIIFFLQFYLNSCQVRVIKPVELQKATFNRTFPAVFSNFGRIPYGLELVNPFLN